MSDDDRCRKIAAHVFNHLGIASPDELDEWLVYDREMRLVYNKMDAQLGRIHKIIIK